MLAVKVCVAAYGVVGCQSAIGSIGQGIDCGDVLARPCVLVGKGSAAGNAQSFRTDQVAQCPTSYRCGGIAVIDLVCCGAARDGEGIGVDGQRTRCIADVIALLVGVKSICRDGGVACVFGALCLAAICRCAEYLACC